MTIGRLKYAVKVTVAHVLYGLGLLQLWQRVSLRRRAVVLMYHRVLTDHERRATGSHPGMVVTRATFDRHLRLLQRRFTPLALGQFAAHMRDRQPFPDSSCLITFDDGWRDNLANALPALRTHRLPAAIFLPVDFVGSQRLFAREAFTHMVLRARDVAAAQPTRGVRLRAVLEAAGMAHLLDLEAPNPRLAVIDAIGAAPVEAAIETAATALAHELDLTIAQLDTPDRFMTWPEVTALADEGRVTFGGHGADHRRLALLSADECAADVRRSKDVLGAHLEPAVWAFAYPNGSCNDAVAATVGAAGFELAFTTAPGSVRCDDHPLLLKRVNIHEDMTASAPMFLARLVGLF